MVDLRAVFFFKWFLEKDYHFDRKTIFKIAGSLSAQALLAEAKYPVRQTEKKGRNCPKNGERESKERGLWSFDYGCEYRNRSNGHHFRGKFGFLKNPTPPPADL